MAHVSVVGSKRSLKQEWAIIQSLLYIQLSPVLSDIQEGIGQDLLDRMVILARGELMEELAKIAIRMSDSGHEADAGKVLDIRKKVIEADLTSPEVINAIMKAAN